MVCLVNRSGLQNDEDNSDSNVPPHYVWLNDLRNDLKFFIHT